MGEGSRRKPKGTWHARHRGRRIHEENRHVSQEDGIDEAGKVARPRREDMPGNFSGVPRRVPTWSPGRERELGEKTMNHSAYCMMVRSTYDLWKKDAPKRETETYEYVMDRPTRTRKAKREKSDLDKLLDTQNAAYRKYNKGELDDDTLIDWCVRSIRRKKLGDVRDYEYLLGSDMRKAIEIACGRD